MRPAYFICTIHQAMIGSLIVEAFGCLLAQSGESVYHEGRGQHGEHVVVCRYETTYASRTGDRTDGCLTFWRKQRFTAKATETVFMRDHGLRDNVALLVSWPALPQHCLRWAMGTLCDLLQLEPCPHMRKRSDRVTSTMTFIV